MVQDTTRRRLHHFHNVGCGQISLPCCKGLQHCALLGQSLQDYAIRNQQKLACSKKCGITFNPTVSKITPSLPMSSLLGSPTNSMSSSQPLTKYKIFEFPPTFNAYNPTHIHNVLSNYSTSIGSTIHRRVDGCAFMLYTQKKQLM